MSQGYRCIILAVAGWLILAASTPPNRNDGADEQSPNQRQIAETLNSIDATLKKPVKPDMVTQPCESGEDRRDSELCAQWKAADAATTATLTNWIFGTLSVLIGAVTMIAAIRAAVYAKKAAHHTAAGVIEATKAVRATVSQQRPWVEVVSIAVNKLSFQQPYDGAPNGSLSLEFLFKCRNVGPTPALRIGYQPILWCDDQGGDFFGRYRSVKDRADATIVTAQEIDWNRKALFPGTASEGKMSVQVVLPDNVAWFNITPWLLFSVGYQFEGGVGRTYHLSSLRVEPKGGGLEKVTRGDLDGTEAELRDNLFEAQ